MTTNFKPVILCILIVANCRQLFLFCRYAIFTNKQKQTIFILFKYTVMLQTDMRERKMEIIGFIFICIFGLGLSLLFLVICSQMLPEYNIGGVPNKWYDRLIVLVFAVILYYGWKFIFVHSPFTLTIAT